MLTLLGRPIVLLLLLTLPVVGAPAAVALVAAQDPTADFGSVFDEHWERLRDGYPYFELYGVDWEAERADHRPRAVAAESATEFAWEMARLLSVLKDPHVEYTPPIDLVTGWSIPDLRTGTIERKHHVLEWGEGQNPVGPAPFREDPRAYPEIISVQGTPIGSGVEILVAGPVGTTVEVRLRWPDGTETDEELQRPDVSNLPPPGQHFGERWVVHGRVGSIGYLRVKTFDPKRGTLGPAGKMTPILREHLTALLDTDALILDLQGNGGGVVGASDPFLSHFLARRQSYQWGNSGGSARVLVPRSPRYTGAVVALVDEKSASGGEWAARILRDAGRATVVGGPTLGAEAAVHRSAAADGSMIQFSAWPMVEPGVTSFQSQGVELDHALPLTIEAARAHGYDEALRRVRRARFAQALAVLGAPADDLDALLALADEADREEAAEVHPATHRVDTVSLSVELESLGGIGGVSLDAEGNIILANFNKYVWRISPEGDVQVLADHFSASSGNTVLRNGDILQADFKRQSILRIGDEVEVFSDEGLTGPVGLVEGPEGDVYVANFSGGYIARVPATGGAAVVFARHDRMKHPNSIVRASSGDFFVADLRTPVLFKISAEGEVTELATLPGSANGHLAILDGALYVTQFMDHRVVRVEFDGSFRVVAGTGTRGFEDGAEGTATVSYPNGIAPDPAGRFLWFNNHRGVSSSGVRGDILLRRLHVDR